jgi:hypothetical protein
MFHNLRYDTLNLVGRAAATGRKREGEGSHYRHRGVSSKFIDTTASSARPKALVTLSRIPSIACSTSKR